MKFAPMAIPAMALLQQHEARRDIVIEPAARHRAAIEARGHSELRAFGTGGFRNWGRNRAVKTHRFVGMLIIFLECVINSSKFMNYCKFYAKFCRKKKFTLTQRRHPALPSEFKVKFRDVRDLCLHQSLITA